MLQQRFHSVGVLLIFGWCSLQILCLEKIGARDLWQFLVDS